jgi:spermidine synthase
LATSSPAQSFPSPGALPLGKKRRRLNLRHGKVVLQWPGGDNAHMRKPTQDLAAIATPLLHDENGELSLHFGFPTIQSRMLRADPERLLLDYTRTMMGFLLFQPKAERIAMIGLGGGSLAKYCRGKLPAADFTAVELSSEVIALRKEFGIPDDDARFRIVCADGADFVRDKVDAFDVLLVDGFDGNGQPRQLCSAAFYACCHAALRPGGVLVVNLCADDAGYGRYIARIRDSFDERVVVIEADEGENKIVFACKDANFPPKLKELTESLRSLEAIHAVDLDKTAQKILRRQLAPRGGRGKRR